MTLPTRGQRLVDDARANGYRVVVGTATDKYEVWVHNPNADDQQEFHLIWDRTPSHGRWRITWIDDGGETSESKLSLAWVRHFLGLEPTS